MAGIALIFGTLFWLTIFFCLMVAFFVLVDDGFGGKGITEAAIALLVMFLLAVPLSFLARKLSAKAVAAAEKSDAEEVKERETPRRVNRRSRQG